MAAAMGFGVITEQGALLTGEFNRVPQGGTWSAVHQQYATLQCVGITPQREKQQLANIEQVMARKGVDYIGECVRRLRCVHIDDTMSSGNDARELDRERMEFRERSATRYGVVWKTFEPSEQEKRVVGVLVNAVTKSWKVVPKWADGACEAMAEGGETDEEWLRGVGVWVQQVMHTPGIHNINDSGG